jgi:hypothetical protein
MRAIANLFTMKPLIVAVDRVAKIPYGKRFVFVLQRFAALL